MRARLALTAAGVTAMIVLAFCIPLGRLISVVAANRALDAAQLESRSLAGAISALPGQTATIAQLVDQANAGSPRPITVYLPDGAVLGSQVSALARSGVGIADFSLGQPSLDEVFLTLTAVLRRRCKSKKQIASTRRRRRRRRRRRYECQPDDPGDIHACRRGRSSPSDLVDLASTRSGPARPPSPSAGGGCSRSSTFLSNSST